MSEKSSRRGKHVLYYPLGDRPTDADCQPLGLRAGNVTSGLCSLGVAAGNVKGSQGQRRIKAVWTGEKRPPRKGEWYLSGAIIAAYRAPNDLSSEYHIARLVVTETREIEVEV